MKKILACITLLTSWGISYATVKLPEVFSDHMVVQRDREIYVWGWADAGEGVLVEFNGQKRKAKADRNGRWKTVLAPMKFGGPFEMKISGSRNNLVLTDILVGDVWVCSGQSNMEWILKNTENAGEAITASDHPNIRLFTVPKEMSFTPLEDLSAGEWLLCTAENTPDFSAVAYYFGAKISAEENIPVGLIHTSWGGTNIEAWTSWDVMSSLEEYSGVSLEEQTKDAATAAQNRERYTQALKSDAGLQEKWYEPKNRIESEWKKIKVPAEWGSTDIGNTDGIVWYRKEFNLPPSFSGVSATLHLGPIDDWDETFVNGSMIGSTKDYSAERIYSLKSGLLKPGNNEIVVKVTDNQGGGGFMGNPEQIFLETSGSRINLSGEWLFKPSVLSSQYGVVYRGPNSFPSQLFNSMIAPLIPFGIKGVIWYQGESNAGRAYRYRTLFPDLINDWRSRWGYDFTFLWVQLANFMKPDEQPVESEWAELREAQHMTLSLPKTGEAVAIDIGEADDIHPRNKKDVGERLALAAFHVTYGKDIVYSGPTFKAMSVDGDKVRLTFDHTGSGLSAKDKYGYVRGFALAGGDKKFKWAKGYIEGDTVVLYHEDIPDPVAVRYAWGNNPDDANLYNKEGLPASPFRTDQWPGITQNK